MLIAQKSIKIKTPQGIVEVSAGDTFTPLNPEQFIKKGVAVPVRQETFLQEFNKTDNGLIPCNDIETLFGVLKMTLSEFKKGGYLARIRCRYLGGEEVFLASTEKEAAIGKAEGLVVYLADELINLIRSKATPAEVRAVHIVKSSLGGTLTNTEPMKQEDTVTGVGNSEGIRE